MAKLSLITQVKAIARQCVSSGIIKQVSNILDKIFLNQRFKDIGAIVRQRKFCPASLFQVAVNACASAVNNLGIEAIRQEYNLLVKNPEKKMSPSSFHDKITDAKVLNGVVSVTQDLLNTLGSIYVTSPILAKLYSYLHEKLGITRVISQDGTEVSVRPSCVKTRGASPRGKHKGDGASGSPTEKLHIAFGFVRVDAVVVTPSAQKGEGERKNCLVEELQEGFCLLADRGYHSDEFFDRIANTGALFAIRVRENIASKIVHVNNRIQQKRYINRKANEFSPTNFTYDFNVQLASGSIYRLIKTTKYGEHIYIMTNIGSDSLTYNQILTLYRIRWILSEIGNKCLKSGNNLESMNSSNENYADMFYCFAICAYCIKEIIANVANLVSQERGIVFKKKEIICQN